eukprot:SAG31_NODE_9051_length_1342_cov_20.896219_2_plen_60_part_00
MQYTLRQAGVDPTDPERRDRLVLRWCGQLSARLGGGGCAGRQSARRQRGGFNLIPINPN